MERGKLLRKIPADYTIIDLETTGINPKLNHILEVGCIKFRNHKEIERYETLIRTPHKISKKITQITGITDDMLINAPTIEEVAHDIWNFLDNEVIVGHNVNFDINFLYNNFYSILNKIFMNNYVDTIQLCKRKYPEFENYRLENICNELGINANFHRAINDCLAVNDIINRIIKNENTGEEKNMAINLKKGQKVDLTKNNPNLKNILVGLGWGLNGEFDLDASVFLLGIDGKVTAEEDFIFYNNLKHSSGSVEHLGDNLKGDNINDSEQIIIDLSKIPAHIEKIDFVITIYEAEEKSQNFGQIDNAFIRIVDLNNNKELIRYDLGKDFSVETAIVVAELYRNKEEWKFQAIGSGFIGGLAALSRNYGIDSGRKSERASIVMYQDVKIAVKKLAAIHQVKISDIIDKALKQYIDEHSEEIKKYDNFIKNLK